jgi:class 3 adenylate cyclase
MPEERNDPGASSRPGVSQSDAMFKVLRQSADGDVVNLIEHLVRNAPDHKLYRINVLDFASSTGLDEEHSIAAFLHATRIGIFDLSWGILCPGCGSLLDAATTLKNIRHEYYECSLCIAENEITLDEMVEVSFTVAPRVRKIPAHEPETLPIWEYYRQILWSSAIDLPDNFQQLMEEAILDSVELSPGETARLSLTLPESRIIVFEPKMHSAQYLDVHGQSTRERRNISIVYTNERMLMATVRVNPGPLLLSLENRSNIRVLPTIWVIGTAVYRLLHGSERKRFLTAKRLLSNQTFRDLYRAETLDVRQRLKITSMTFLFTDLKGSTALYERVGDLAAYDLVHAHFDVLAQIVAAQGGAIVKTIGDAVMATFPTPRCAVAAALAMRVAMRKLSEGRTRDDLLLKIGIHEGPCLAVTLNDHQDYFGRTVNVTARVQQLATAQSILATRSVVEDPETSILLQKNKLAPLAKHAELAGISDGMIVYEIQ